MNASHPMSQRRIEAITAALKSGQKDLRELAAVVFLCEEQTRRYLAYMHVAKLVYIAKWRVRHAGNDFYVAVYRLGARADVARPAPMTGAKKQAASRARILKDRERRDVDLARRRARRWKVTQDPLVAAMFGPPAGQSTERCAGGDR